ncbi:MAG: ABC transporter permease, partial [Alphaproteobacteria bacterium]|nr:ABC transporter permease [Alphaproteobacteria bacterium]
MGVSTIAGVQSLADAILSSLANQGQILLGGDAAVRLVHRPVTSKERTFLASFGKLSETASLRAMAYRIRNGRAEERQLIELKAVDILYPLFGTLEVVPSPKRGAARPACAAGNCSAFAEQSLIDRLGPGNAIRIGMQDFHVAAIVSNEPDRLSGGFSLGPHVIVSLDGLERTGLLQPGSLVDYSYRIALRPGISPARFKQAASEAFPDAGWEIRTRDEAAPGLRDLVEEITLFLTLVGLTALALGGIGGNQAVRSYVAARGDEIAILKSLGSDGSLLLAVFLTRIGSVCIAATGTGLAIGAMVPFLAGSLFHQILGAAPTALIQPQALMLAAAFGVLAGLAFSLLPLARVRQIAPAQLFRERIAPTARGPTLGFLASALAAGAAILGLAAAIAPSSRFAMELSCGVIGIFFVFVTLARGLRLALVRLPRPGNTRLRFAIANLTRPGSQTGNVIAALGLGFSLLTAITFLESSIASEIEQSLPTIAPSFFFVDIQPDQVAAFDGIIHSFREATAYQRTPMIRGRIVSLKGIPSAAARVSEQSKWALAGDRGITYASTLPSGNRLVEGRWWPPNYSGPTLISFDSELARGMGLSIGDAVTLNVLGREIEGRIANLRDVNFRTARQNFILILSPGLIDKAPHTFLATVHVPQP